MYSRDLEGFGPVVAKANRIRLEERKVKESMAVRAVRLARRIDAERRDSVRLRLSAELDRIFRAAYRFRMKG
jgi:hypothetical protein